MFEGNLMLILGLNAFHADAAACIVRDGNLIAAVEEERFRRTKHWAGFPTEAVKFCLAEAGAKVGDLDHIAVNQDSRAGMWQRMSFLLRTRPSPRLVASRLSTRNKRATAYRLIENMFSGQPVRAKVHRVEHHLAHMSSAFYVSPFKEATIVSVDGFGDFSSTAWGEGTDTAIEINNRVYFPHSLGIFYQALTQFLGFPHYGDEYKVMGLAPYGQPRFLHKMRKIIDLKPDGRFELNTAYFRHHREFAPYQWENGSPVFDGLFSSALEDLLGPRRGHNEPLEQVHKDLARSTQAMYEEAFFNIIAATRSAGATSPNLVLAGGCANNSVANGKVRRQTPYQRVYVHAAPGDAGGAIGAAFVVWHRLGGKRGFVMDHAFWGPSFSDDTCSAVLKARETELEAAGCTTTHIDNISKLCAHTAAAVADGRVVGWFQGRMEWGPRALGNRSIIGDPRRADMKAILNDKIKRREGFRPFAPSILREYVSDWFEEEDDVPFMMQVFQIKKMQREKVPAVAHVDGSGRLQTVDMVTNARYWNLIESFRNMTGVPMVLNTSFNENEPVVCKPEEALDCFIRTKMDMLVLGDYVVERS